MGIVVDEVRMDDSAAAKRCASRAEVIKALSHPSRILIAEALDGGEMSVRELPAIVGADISTVSKHLTIMRNVGLVECEKRGLNRFYKLAGPCLNEFFKCVDQIADNA